MALGNEMVGRLVNFLFWIEGSWGVGKNKQHREVDLPLHFCFINETRHSQISFKRSFFLLHISGMQIMIQF